jgi:lipopolysaccharide export system protein LptA
VKLLIHYFKLIACILITILLAGNVFAQKTTSPTEDSLQEVEILSATKRLTFKTVDDTTKLTIIVGDVKLRQGTTLFYCDSCVINNNTNIFEAWGKGGKVHINDSDTTNIYSSHLRYLMKPKLAYLDGGVTLTDGKATLTTPDLEYDMETNIGIYKNGGKVVNKKTTLTSQEGWYYADMKDVYFKKNVVLKDPAYNIVTDSLLYNSESQTTRFISMTTITDSSGRIIKTREGYYNQQTGKAEFGQRPVIVDGNTEITGNTVSIDDSSGISVVQGNAIIVDKKNKTTIIGGAIYRNKKTEAIMAIRKPLMIIVQDNDSIYISADTLFSARLTDLYAAKRSVGLPVAAKDTSSVQDSTIRINPKDSLTQDDIVKDTVIIENNPVAIQKKDLPPGNRKADTLVTRKRGELNNFKDSVTIDDIAKDTLIIEQNPEAIPLKDSITGGKTKADTLVQHGASGLKNPKDSVWVHTTKGIKMVAINEKDSTNRYFEAYRNVRIFNDSLQAACDSMFYSFKDSVFRLYDDPVVWAKESQITGDTLLLFTKNKKADRIQAFENSLLVNKMTEQAFNQIKSTRMDGYFVNGDIDSVRAKGSAECIYYIQDDDSAYTGINQSKADIMDIYFRNKELFKVVFRSSVTGTLWPIRQKSPSEMRLPNFKWLEEKRPKSKFEMYE